MIEKNFEPSDFESKWYDFWDKNGFFVASHDSDKPKYVIILPPPNVTGVLHIGHALTATLEDILIRWRRMQGYNVLWLPGVDHAGIATQMVVEREILKKEGKTRHELGRNEFLKRVWKWKEESQATILNQFRLIGCSLDWTRLRFTLDDVSSLAVKESFVRLFKEGLIYRDTSMIQWCPRCRTALSDLEVKFKERNGKLWYIKYKLADRENEFITIATTRPETLLGDTALAVNPLDERYKSYIGKKVIVPLVKRVVPVISEDLVDINFGTGALKVTPAHDLNDFFIGQKHNLERVTIFDEAAHIIIEPYYGLSREKGREKVVEDLKAQDLLSEIKDYKHNIGHCDRCSTMIEPRISTQWFLNAKEIAKDAILAVKNSEINIIPEEWKKTYFEWLENIRPWCISRQLWWGHRIPVWYCKKCGNIFSSVEEPNKCNKCESFDIFQEEDVLDTWFSSALWPFSTLGWPKETKDYKAFYPTSVMETGFDILFFWVARMIMMGKKLTGLYPFKTVYLHPMIRDEYGQKMSKTKGNVKDPLEIIKITGADSLRFTLASMAIHGRDLLLSESRINGYRNFMNKIWNATRFILRNYSNGKNKNENIFNSWITSKLETLKIDINEALENFRFYEAADKIYHFIWSDFCDWYIEFIKDESVTDKNDETPLLVLEEILRLSHPFIPFITEELWQKLPLKKQAPSIMVSKYPKPSHFNQNINTEKIVSRLIEIIEKVRSKRGEHSLKPSTEISLTIVTSTLIKNEILPYKNIICRFTKAKEIFFSESEPNNSIIIPIEGMKIFIPKSEIIDENKEIEKLETNLSDIKAELERANQKLNNDEFLKKAPKEVVEGVKNRQKTLLEKAFSIEKYLDSISKKQ